ncbi:MAG: RNA methyltransferase, partial [Bacteroidota bacterium]
MNHDHISLPDDFQNTMATKLGDEFELFKQSLSQATPTSIRYNANKIQEQHLNGEKIPWTSSGYYLDKRPV